MTFIGDQAEDTWEIDGFACAMVRSPVNGKCGYVRMPEPFRSRKLLADGIDYDEVQVHGGLTYGMDEDGWVGFDTSHLGDRWLPDTPDDPPSTLEKALVSVGAEMEPISPYTKFWTTEKLRWEVCELAKQLKVWCERHPDFESEFSTAENIERARESLRRFAQQYGVPAKGDPR